jgi:hypothetical protein
MGALWLSGMAHGQANAAAAWDPVRHHRLLLLIKGAQRSVGRSCRRVSFLRLCRHREARAHKTASWGPRCVSLRVPTFSAAQSQEMQTDQGQRMEGKSTPASCAATSRRALQSSGLSSLTLSPDPQGRHGRHLSRFRCLTQCQQVASPSEGILSAFDELARGTNISCPIANGDRSA